MSADHWPARRDPGPCFSRKKPSAQPPNIPPRKAYTFAAGKSGGVSADPLDEQSKNGTAFAVPFLLGAPEGIRTPDLLIRRRSQNVKYHSSTSDKPSDIKAFCDFLIGEKPRKRSIKRVVATTLLRVYLTISQRWCRPRFSAACRSGRRCSLTRGWRRYRSAACRSTARRTPR